jgi:hypothetical protein
MQVLERSASCLLWEFFWSSDRTKLKVYWFGRLIAWDVPSHDVVICDWGLVLLDMPASIIVDLALCWYCAIWYPNDGVYLRILVIKFLLMLFIIFRCSCMVVAIIFWFLRMSGCKSAVEVRFVYTRFTYASSISDLSPFWGFTFATALDQCCTYQLVTLFNEVHLLEYYWHFFI